MRKLLNTVYVTNEMAYLTLDGENLVCKIDGEIKLRIPLRTSKILSASIMLAALRR